MPLAPVAVVAWVPVHIAMNAAHDHLHHLSQLGLTGPSAI